jgi:hypothetical protein
MLLLALVVLGTALNELQCIKYSCASRVGDYGNVNAISVERKSNGTGRFVGGGSVLFMNWRIGTGVGRMADTMSFHTPKEDIDGEVDDGNEEWGRTFQIPDGDLIDMSTDHNVTLKNAAAEAGKGKWVNDDHDLVLKTQKYIQGKKATAIHEPNPRPTSEQHQTHIPSAALKELIPANSIQRARSKQQVTSRTLPNNPFRITHTLPTPRSVLDSKVAPPVSETKHISQQDPFLIPTTAVATPLPRLSSVSGAKIGRMNFGSMDMDILGG